MILPLLKSYNFEKIFNFPIEIIRSNKRKTIAIQISEVAIIVRTPYWYSKYAIDSFIIKNSNWIQKKIYEKKTKEKYEPKRFINLEKFTLIGQDYKLKIIDSTLDEPKIVDNLIIVKKGNSFERNDFIKEQTIKLLKKIAEQTLIERTNYYSEIIGAKPRSIRIKNYKSRWGSCSSKRELSYNWRIIFSPLIIIDYLVVHELCHLIHFNHSSKFWKLVETIIDDYKDRKKWLKDNGFKLNI